MLLVDSRHRARVLVDSSSIFVCLLFRWMLLEASAAVFSGWYLVAFGYMAPRIPGMSLPFLESMFSLEDFVDSIPSI